MYINYIKIIIFIPSTHCAVRRTTQDYFKTVKTKNLNNLQENHELDIHQTF